MKIALLIPSTSRDRDWKETGDCYLLNYLLQSFKDTYNSEHEYTIYIGIDEDDKYYHNEQRARELQDFIGLNIPLKFIVIKSRKGHVTDIWNKLFYFAYQEGNEYFVQAGDDVTFLDKGWDNACIKILESNNNIGVVGFTDETRKNCDKLIYTQTFVHRCHFDIFKFYFPPEITNWYCDDWITNVYKETNDGFLTIHRIANLGGKPRYKVVDCPVKCNYLVKKYKLNIGKFKLSDNILNGSGEGETIEKSK